MQQYREVTSRDWLKAFINILLFVALLVYGAIVLAQRWWPIGFIIWLVVIVGGGTYSFVRWHARNFAYQCPNCENEFEISTGTDFVTPNGFTRKYLKCPKCNQRAWMKTLKKEGI
ncbi:MAG: hypothetical protein V1767_07580 [Chloroflexota bacterium]